MSERVTPTNKHRRIKSFRNTTANKTMSGFTKNESNEGPNPSAFRASHVISSNKADILNRSAQPLAKIYGN
jgi:hypothetical protein